ncbi:MAG TPA: hypothetical protein VF171_06700 [Trueperaceae bacterium]
MKHRLIDTALLVGLGIVAAVIAYSLLNLGRQPHLRVVSSDPPVTTGTANEAAEAPVLPVLPEVEPAARDSAQEEPEPAPEQEAEAAAPGAVTLNQIGFSYVTGGAGACGITLEPWKHIAVSRELLERYGCGAKVHVTLGKEVGGHKSFDAIIADTMSPTWTRTVNIYIGKDEPAFQYGLLDEGTLTAEDQGG